MMTKRISIILLSLIPILLSAQKDLYRYELEQLYDISTLPAYRTGDMYQISSYDPTGGNDDGFSGKYSYIRKDGDEYVIADIKGTGLINRIWTPTPSNDTIKFYFDGEKAPRINLPFIDLFSGKVYPFISPLCGNEIGGYFCYLPIVYNESLKITYKGEELKFHQIQYRELPKNTKIESFSYNYFEKNNDILKKIEAIWDKKKLVFDKQKFKSKKINITIHPGEEKQLFSLNNGGRITGIEISAGNDLSESYRKLIFSAEWDNESNKAIELPFHDLFGHAYGKPSMPSIVLGSNERMYYSYLPMPFDNSAKLSVKYNGCLEKESEITISGTIYYTEEKRDKKSEGKLYAQSRREYLPEKGKPYLIADIQGKGHYIGTILVAQGLEEGMTLFWEGDDCSYIDGKMRMHGTGSEDYFNGGWYAVTDRWDTGIGLPIHGALAYDLKTARTGGYRFFLSDKINFNSSYKLTIEHGPEGNELDVDYTSVGLFYGDNPQFKNEYTYAPEKTVKRRDILLAQDLTMRLYWFTTTAFGDSSMLISSKREDSWMTNIDFEAVPMVQFDLTGLDKGKYKLYIVHHAVKGGNPFSVWQRTRQISEWITTDINEEKATSYVGEFEIDEQIKSITLRKKKMDDTIVNIDQFIIEKIEE